MDSVNLSASTSIDNSFDPQKCIICQISSSEKTVSTSNGCKRIREASVIRNDQVTKRLKLVDGDQFLYHISNDCYKSYTMKSVLERISRRNANVTHDTPQHEQELPVSRERNTRSRLKVREPPNSASTTVGGAREINCIICNNKSYKHQYAKFRISESNRAASFLAATNYFQDDVFSRTCDLQDPHSVFGADIHYHNECMIKYLYKYDTRAKNSEPQLSRRQLAWNQVVPELQQGMANGRGYELYVIRDRLNAIDDQCNFRNRDVRVFLENQFGDNLSFTYPDSSHTSTMVFSTSSNSMNDLVECIRSVDPIKVCASVIRQCLDEYDFDLEDRFCDEQELRHACKEMPIPQPLLQFLGVLYNFKPDSYHKTSRDVMAKEYVDHSDDESDESDCDDDDAARHTDGTISIDRCRKVQALFQIMYYVHHRGKKRTPLHILNAESVHSLGRGGKIVTSILNHEGLAVSYTELRRYQHDLAAFTAQHNQNRVKLPCHFDPGQFTSGAIDNWDHETANVSEHDTVTVLYQDKPLSPTTKPKISETEVTHGPRAFKEILPCQIRTDFHKPARHPDLPTSYTVNDQIQLSTDRDASKVKDTAWSLSRLDVKLLKQGEVSVLPGSQKMPSWSASNSVWTKENIPVKNLAFLPVMPHPVTEYATVYSAMTNFVEISSQLLQHEIPMYCDQGVYCIVRAIKMMRPDEFETLFPVLGTFHMVKVVLRCIGKYLAGSGAETTWLETGIFGPTTIENSVMSGGHYNRSLEGMQLLAEAFQRLLYKEFFTEHDVEQYTAALSVLDKLKSSVETKNISDSQMHIDEFAVGASKMISDLDAFIEARSTANENFKFWAQFLSMMDIVHDLLRADREGLWALHIDAVQRALYLFAAFDCTNYHRWCSVYLEDMRKLHQTAPSVYEQFARGNFSIKDKPGRFTAVGGDQKLEQSINLSSKCSDGVIGHARQKQYVAQWDLIYHEMIRVKNLHREYAGVEDNTHESYSHHRSSLAITKRNEIHVQGIINFVEEKGSPFSTKAPTTLHNFVTREVMSEDIREDMLNVVTKGKEKYLKFRQDRFVDRNARISETIHRSNLKTMKTNKNKPSRTIQKAVKEVNAAEKVIEIARDRGITTEDFLQYDVAPSPLLFTADGIMTKPDKSQLLKELETHLTSDDYRYTHQTNSAFIIDIMATIRRIRVNDLSTFHDLLKMFSSLTEAYHKFGRCDFVFDMYSDEPSVKDSERMRRSNTLPIEHTSIDPGTPLPKQMETFWPSKSNKLLLEKLIYDSIHRNTTESRHFPVVLGQVTKADENWHCIMIHGGKETVVPELQSSLEEADLRIPIHVMDTIQKGYSVCVVISNDTDVIVALLYHMPLYLQHGLVELWVRAGVGDTTRYVPLHTLFHNLGGRLCAVLPALHSLTGCDITSRVGTKKAALKAEPDKFLKYFGTTSTLSPTSTSHAEEYLVNVLKKTSTATNFQELRVEMFHYTKSSSLHNIPPTSQGISSHIQRAFFNAYTMMHSLESHMEPGTIETIKPEDHGYEEDQGYLVPATTWKTIPNAWSVFCSCNKCARSSCACRMASVKCGNFCRCKKASSSPCKNPIV